MNRLFIWIIVSVFVVVIVSVIVLQIRPIELISIDGPNILKVITPIFFVSLIVERLMAYLIYNWRGEHDSLINLKISELKEELSCDVKHFPEIKENLSALRRKKIQYEHNTQTLKNWASLFVGIIISVIGIRAIQPIVKPESLAALSVLQRSVFHLMDIVLTGVLISGGTTIIDSITSTLSGLAHKARNGDS